MCDGKNDNNRGGAVGTVLIENERVRVTRWDFPNQGGGLTRVMTW